MFSIERSLTAGGALLCLLLSACGHDSRYYIARGDQLREAGKYGDAVVTYRKALQKDGRAKDAYYGLAQAELKQDHWLVAYQNLRQAAQIAPDDPKILAALGDIVATAYMAEQRYPKHLYDELASISDRLLRKDAKSFDGLRFQGYLAMSDGHLKEAADRFRDASAIKPLAPTVVMPWIRTLMRDHQDSEAEKLALAVIANDKSNPAPWNLLYELYLNSGRRAEAEKLLRSKSEQNPNEPAYVLELATYYYRSNKRAEMDSTINSLVARRKDLSEVDLKIGDFYTALGDRRTALEYYNHGLQSDSRDKLSYRKRLLALALADGRSADAFRAVDEILREAPHDLTTRLVQASLEFDRGNPDVAMAALQKLMAEDPNSALVRYNLGRGYLVKGNEALARTQFLEAIRLQPAYLEPRFSLAAMSEEHNDSQGVLTRANEILTLDPENRAAKLLHCSGLIGTGSFPAARAELRSLLKQSPGSRDVQLQFARLDLAEGKFTDAERSFREMLSAPGHDLRTVKGLAEVYARQNQPDKAIQAWEQELQKQPTSLPAREGLADTAFRVQRYDLAVAQYQQLIGVKPSPEYYRRVGLSYAMKGDTGSAMANLQQVVRLLPTDSDAHMMIAALLERGGRPNEALAEYRLALQLSPEDPRIMNNLAFLLAETGGALDESLKLAERAHAKLPLDAKISDTLGCIYLKKKMTDSAVQTFGAIVLQNPDEMIYHYHFAQALMESGDIRRAKAELELALASRPSAVEAANIRKMLSGL